MTSNRPYPLTWFLLCLCMACSEPSEGSHDEDTGISQNPITVEIVNAHDHAVYVRLTTDFTCQSAQPEGAYRRDGQWIPVQFFVHQDPCFCEGRSASDLCDCEGDFENPLTALAPGATLSLIWDGNTVLEGDDTVLRYNLECLWRSSVLAGQYRMSVTYHTTYASYEEDDLPEPDENGKIPWASGTGESRVQTVEFELPTTRSSLRITLESSSTTPPG